MTAAPGPAAVAARPGTAVVGLDALSPGLREADALAGQVVEVLRERGALDGAVVATHLTRLGPLPHVTVSVAAPALDAAELGAALAAAVPGAAPSAGADEGAAAHAAGTSGRAVHFPGVELLVGTLPVADVLAHTAVEAVRVLGGGAVEPEDRLVTRDFVRPGWVGGRLELVVERAARGTVVPFEVPAPTPCCADHA